MTLSPAYKTITRNRCVGAGLCPSRSIYGNPIDRSFVGADDSVRPVRNGTIIVRAGRVARPYNRLTIPGASLKAPLVMVTAAAHHIRWFLRQMINF